MSAVIQPLLAARTRCDDIGLRVAERLLPDRALCVLRAAEERQFATMDRAFARHGGLADATDVAWLMRRYRGHPVTLLGQWISQRRVLSIPWQSRRLVPLFQFIPTEMTLRGAAVDAARELAAVHDDWGVALWFAQPHALLAERPPVDVLQGDGPAVIRAAKADARAAR
jgi:hypothetical protein